MDTSLRFWLCEQYWKETKCKARMHVSNRKAVKFIGEHNHVPNDQRKKVLDVIARFKLQGARTVALRTQIIMEAMSNLNQNTAAQMQEECTLKRMV